MMRFLAPIVPYVAVLVGEYLMTSGWAAILLYHAGIVVFCALLGGWRMKSKLLRGWNGPIFVSLLVLCLLSGPALYVLYPLLAPRFLDLGEGLASLGLRNASWLSFIVYYVLVNPWLEELYWRGLLGSASSFPTPTDALYAGYHVLVLWKFLPPCYAVLPGLILLVAAWIWRRIAARCGGLLIPAVTHLAADASIIVAVHLLASPA